MSMHELIDRTLTDIVDDWEAFVRQLRPSQSYSDLQGLRDGAEALLQAMSADLAATSHPRPADDLPHACSRERSGHVTRAARAHAAEWLARGYTLKELVMEYHTLRRAVVRRWYAELPSAHTNELDELERFNDCIDHALTESAGWFFERVEDARDLVNGVLAHDLRNPLGTILVSLEFLLTSDLESPYIKAATHIRNSAKRMETMINEILDFTRTRLGGGLPVTPEDADLGTLCRGIVDELRAFHPDAHLHLEQSGDLGGRWDSSRMGQLMSNLISNAIEHGRKDSMISIVVSGNVDHVMLRVHNEGAPISPEAQDAIFDPWRSAAFRHRAASARTRAGLGLGLYICREIVQGHGGSIGVSSDDTGTTFTVRLPRRFESRGDSTLTEAKGL